MRKQNRVAVSTMTAPAKVLVSVVAAGSLLLTACGKDADNTDNAAASAASSAATSASAAASSASAPASSSAAEASVAEMQNPDGEQPPAPEDQMPPTAQPDSGVEIPEAMRQAAQLGEEEDLAPIENGQPASDADRQQIQDLVFGLDKQTTIRSYIGYVPSHTCRAVVEANGGEAATDVSGLPDLPLSEWPQYRNANPKVNNVDNVLVQGDLASANVTATSGGQTRTDVQRFAREDGQWKFCR